MSERNPIRVFATHNFDESDDYLRVFEFLESVDRFYYINVSAPENLPATGDAQGIRSELIRQVKQAEAVFVLSSTYAANPDLVNFIMDVAEANKIGMIAIPSFGGVQPMPDKITQRCAQVVDWNDRAMVDAVKHQARGEDTARWDAIDFPGWDADGPIED